MPGQKNTFFNEAISRTHLVMKNILIISHLKIVLLVVIDKGSISTQSLLKYDMHIFDPHPGLKGLKMATLGISSFLRTLKRRLHRLYGNLKVYIEIRLLTYFWETFDTWWVIYWESNNCELLTFCRRMNFLGNNY